VKHTVLMNPAPVRPDRTLPILLSVLGLLIVVALAVVFLRPQAALRDAATPEGVVQRYSAAVIDGNEEAASGYLADTAEPCAESYGRTEQNRRVALVSAREQGNTAEVEVSIVTFTAGGPFGSSEYESRDMFDLVRTNGTWLIERAPWELRACTGGTGSL
jgi:hypothetical protein